MAIVVTIVVAVVVNVAGKMIVIKVWWRVRVGLGLGFQSPSQMKCNVD